MSEKINVKLGVMANLIQKQSILSNQLDKIRDDLGEGFEGEKVIYSLPQGDTFVVLRDKESKYWTTTNDCRWVYKRISNPINLYRVPMLPVGLVNLETKAIVLFNLGDTDSKVEAPRVVKTFLPGFYIYTDESQDIPHSRYPQFSLNLEINRRDWNLHSTNGITYEEIIPSNPKQVREIYVQGDGEDTDGIDKVIGYIPYRTDEVSNPPFEFYQAY